jgi:hypothetical protein
MLYKLVTVVLPFLLPFAGYALYVALQRRAQAVEAATGHPPAWTAPRVGWLALAGALLVAATLMTFRFVGTPSVLQPSPSALDAPPTSFPAQSD